MAHVWHADQAAKQHGLEDTANDFVILKFVVESWAESNAEKETRGLESVKLLTKAMAKKIGEPTSPKGEKAAEFLANLAERPAADNSTSDVKTPKYKNSNIFRTCFASWEKDIQQYTPYDSTEHEKAKTIVRKRLGLN